MKLIIKLLIIVLVFWLAWSYANRNSQGKPIISIEDSQGSLSLHINSPLKEELKGIVSKISNFIYHEATVHNPPGDMVPDQIDDTIKKEVKEKVN
jgi:hypothetical protein